MNDSQLLYEIDRFMGESAALLDAAEQAPPFIKLAPQYRESVEVAKLGRLIASELKRKITGGGTNE